MTIIHIIILFLSSLSLQLSPSYDDDSHNKFREIEEQ